MRVFVGPVSAVAALLTLVVTCGALALAEDNAATGVWKLNAEKSRLNGPPPAFVHGGVMRMGGAIVTARTHTATPTGSASQAASEAGKQRVFKVDLAQDGRTLTLARPGSNPGMKLVFER